MSIKKIITGLTLLLVSGAGVAADQIVNTQGISWTASNIIDKSALHAFVGVILGFAGSEVTQFFKRYREGRTAKEALFDEARFNCEQSKDKIDIITQAIAALEHKRFLPIKCGKFSTIDFENMYHLAIYKLKTKERDNFRHLYSFYKAMDEIIDNFEELFKNDIDNVVARNMTLDKVYQANVTRLKDAKEALTTNLELSKELIMGSPRSIYTQEKISK